MTNEQVVSCFLRGKEAQTPLRNIVNGYYTYKGRSLRSCKNSDYEMLLFNYNTVIARIRDNDLYINITKYSQTTSKIQGLLKHLASSYNFNVIEYDGE